MITTDKKKQWIDALQQRDVSVVSTVMRVDIIKEWVSAIKLG